ncbi:MAG: tRNA (guanosine(46)-N7)-methyltransferase TrmB [Holosporaceae bacterium]|nr:tRNA (guanosine(46)-N7)-methyltransferase TrmB [Holosporaceae bacterium]
MESWHTIQLIPSYGRKRCRGLSDTQKNDITTLYPLYGITSLEDHRDLFGERYSHITLEIGFGNGEWLISQALSWPMTGFIGCDPFENGVAAALRDIHRLCLKNVRIFKGDARVLLEKFSERSIDRICTLFPDPWRKRKHHKRRLLSAEFISNLAHKVTFAGDIIIATDHDDYLSEILKNLRQIPDITYSADPEVLSKKPACFGRTKYESRALDSGRKCYYLRICPSVAQ